MQCYETIYIIHPEAGEGGDTAKQLAEQRIADSGGNIYHRENWGSKRLAYDIRKQSKGNYQLVRFVGGAETVSELERLFRLDESFLKYMTIRLKDDPANPGSKAEEPKAEDSGKAEEPKAEASGEDEKGGDAPEAKGDED